MTHQTIDRAFFPKSVSYVLFENVYISRLNRLNRQVTMGAKHQKISNYDHIIHVDKFKQMIFIDMSQFRLNNVFLIPFASSSRLWKW